MRLLLVPRLRLPCPVEIRGVSGQSPKGMGSQAELGNQKKLRINFARREHLRQLRSFQSPPLHNGGVSVRGFMQLPRDLNPRPSCGPALRSYTKTKNPISGGHNMADVTMPMNGKVISVKAEVGQIVEEDAELIVIEAMKMELPVVATGSGTVKEVKAKVGESYQVGDVLVVIG